MEKLSIVILTMNEENNIRECLETAKWADEIIVVDDFSADKTIEICKEYTDKIFQRKLNSFSEERRFGDEKASGDWILQLDADQRVTPGLRKQIEEILERGTDCDGFMIYKKNSYLGKWMRYAGWRPEVLIMYRRGMQRYNETRAHEKIILEGKVGHLNAEILHKSYESLSEHCPRIVLLGTHPIYYLSPFFGLPRDLNLNILSSFRSIFFIKLSLPMGRPLLV